MDRRTPFFLNKKFGHRRTSWNFIATPSGNAWEEQISLHKSVCVRTLLSTWKREKTARSLSCSIFLLPFLPVCLLSPSIKRENGYVLAGNYTWESVHTQARAHTRTEIAQNRETGKSWVIDYSKKMWSQLNLPVPNDDDFHINKLKLS